MKKLLSLAMAALLVLSICSYALAASEGTPYYYTLSGGVNGKRNTAKVEKESTGAAENVVDYLSRTLADDEPVIMKVRYGANGNPVTDGRDIFVEDTYYMAYTRNEGGVVGKTYYMKMQNTTGSEDVTVSGNFTP